MRITRGRLAALVVLVGIAGTIPAQAAPARDQSWAATGPVGVPVAEENRIYVSVVAAQEQARAFVRVPSGATELTLVEGSGGVSADAAALRLCPTTAPVAGSGKIDDPPSVDCATQVAMSRDSSGVWTAGISALRAAPDGWIAVVPGEGGPAAFTVAFDTTKTDVSLAEPLREPAAPSTGTSDLGGGVPSGAFTPPPLGPSFENPDAETPPVHERVPTSGRTEFRDASDTSRAASPPAFVFLLAVALAAVVLLSARARTLPPTLFPGAAVARSSVVSAGAGVALFMLVSSFTEASVYKLGFVGIVFIAAIGLHLLVNWAGELSLAHASFIGLPAFLVAQLADHTGWTPIIFLPVGVLVGAALGLLVAIPARRARGLQVALVTLAIGIAITQFLFVRSWIIGPRSGLSIPEPSLFGIHFRTSRSLLPVLAVVILVAVFAARAILGSSIGRALSQVRLVPDAAATAGVPVAAYRGAAYALAGAFAGLAGGTYVLWVQRVGPQAFPLNLGFNYLVIATLAGKGGLLGLAVAVVGLEGGRLFSIIPESIGLYLGPIALIYNVTRYQAGINGAFRDMGAKLRDRRHVMDVQTKRAALRLPVVVAGVIVAVGFGAIALAWYHAGNTDQLWVQNQELLSGGIGGGALVVLGAALLIRDALLHGEAVVRRRAVPTVDDH